MKGVSRKVIAFDVVVSTNSNVDHIINIIIQSFSSISGIRLLSLLFWLVILLWKKVKKYVLHKKFKCTVLYL